MIDQINEYGNLINTVLLLGMLTYMWRIFQMTISNQSSQIETLKQQLELSKSFGVEESVNRFRALKEYYEGQKEEWYQITLKKLSKEKEEAIISKEAELQNRVQFEIDEVNRIKIESGQAEGSESKVLDEDSILGKFKVIGYNPNDVEDMNNYEGELVLTKDLDTISATWTIAQGRQQQKGVGILKGNILGLHFWYPTMNKEYRNGVVLYQFIGKDIIRGVWTGKGVNKIGYEEGHRIYDI